MSKRQQWSNICNRVDTCALTGAAAFVAGIPQSEVLINGPLWCYFYALRYLERADYTTSLRIRGSQPDNNAVVYGAEKYIVQALQNLMAEGQKPSVLLLESSCAMSLIGDDLKGIVRKENLPFPVITLDCGGMLGGFAEGYTRAAQSAFELLLCCKASTLLPLPGAARPNTISASAPAARPSQPLLRADRRETIPFIPKTSQLQNITATV
mgnify:CR=1 FL=1